MLSLWLTAAFTKWRMFSKVCTFTTSKIDFGIDTLRLILTLFSPFYGIYSPKTSIFNDFCTIYSVEGEWEYFFAHFRKGVKSFKKGLRMKFGYLEGQFIDFMEDSGG